MEDKQSNLMTFIGMGLIFLMLYIWMQTSMPPKPTQDPATATSVDSIAALAQTAPAQALTPVQSDSATRQQMATKLGAFAAAGLGTEQLTTLENDLMRVRFTNKGGRIKDVLMKKYERINVDSAGNDFKMPLYLLEDEKNRFEYIIPAAGAMGGTVSTSDLFFTATQEGNTVTFRAPATNGGYIEQAYTLSADNYQLDYKVGAVNLQGVSSNKWQLNWLNHLDKLEKNQTYERTMSSVYFKVNDESPDYCDCRKDVTESLGEQPIRWFSHSNQFFNTSFITKDFSFKNFVGETKMLTDADSDLKILRTSAELPMDNLNGGALNMTIYTGPNEFDRLLAYKTNLEDIIPFGSSLFGTINRWVIHPILDVLSRFISNKGIVIIMLTLLVKLLVFPLTYRMVYSQARMAALKPQIDALRKKHGDDQQQISVETMKLYGEFKVNPLGGCLPVFLQMPIWFALYRFFPAAIEFRQAGFLWATDLSSYDVAFKLPFMLPGFGSHISLFTVIWVLTTLWYTWYSMRQMDSSMMNPAMKYMQYFMPLMFMFFFNTFASGLTCYLCFSNLLNVGQTVATKRFLINEDKIKQELEANRNKPKKAGGWRDRLETALKEQQRVQEEKVKQQQKKK
jgi:YidC/Oxa1 family membrane protein insertase